MKRLLIALRAGLFLWIVCLPFLASAGEARSSVRPGLESGPTRIGYRIWIGDIAKIDSVEQTFRMNFLLILHWQDPSMKHDGPGVKKLPLDSIWHPNLLFTNEAGSISKTLPETAEVTPEGEVIYRQRVVGNFTQPLDLRAFPFDHAEFGVSLVAIGYGLEELRFEPDKGLLPLDVKEGIGLEDHVTLQDWTITGIMARPGIYQATPDFSVPDLVFGFSASRNYQHFVLKVLLPLLLIVMMSWAVFWIDPSDTSPQFSISVTSMLTLIAYRFTIEANVPKLPYLTRMDAFILTSSLLIFLSLIEVTTVSKLSKGGRLELGKAIDRHCRWIFPVLFIICAVLTLFH
ncbi:MAG: hypothetical protein QM755_24795 [Luteolibacter sp.]